MPIVPAMDDAPPEPCADLGFDPAQPIWSESVALFVCDADAGAAVSLRMCRYPDAGRAWLWVHAIGQGGAWGYNVDHVPCGTDRTDVDAGDVAYETGTGDGEFRRHGPATAPGRADVSVSVDAHPGLDAPDEAGAVGVTVTGSFVPTTAAGATLPGRTEVFGDAEVRVEVSGGTSFTVAGRAQWHEQHQTDPRFLQPFVYASLRGREQSLVALAGRLRSGGFARGRAGDRMFSEARIEEPAGGRHPIVLVDADHGSEHAGDVIVRHTIHIPIYGARWWGTIVAASLDGSPLTGSINRWQPRPRLARA